MWYWMVSTEYLKVQKTKVAIANTFVCVLKSKKLTNQLITIASDTQIKHSVRMSHL